MADKKEQIKELVREIEKGLCKKYSGVKLKVLRKDIEEALEKTELLKDCVLRVGTDVDLDCADYTLKFMRDGCNKCFIRFYNKGARIFIFFDHFTEKLVKELEDDDFDEKVLVEKMRKFIEDVELFIKELMNKRDLEVKLEHTISKLRKIEENLTKGGIDMCEKDLHENKQSRVYELEKVAEKVLKEIEKKLYEKYKDIRLKANGKDLLKTLHKTLFLEKQVGDWGSLKEDYTYDIYFTYERSMVGAGCHICIEGIYSTRIYISSVIKSFYKELTTKDFNECAFIEEVKKFLDEVEYFVNELSKKRDYEVKLQYVIGELEKLCSSLS